MSSQEVIDPHSAVESLIRVSSRLRIAYEGLNNDWFPDVPPLTIVFSNLGRDLCRHASSLTDVELQKVCDSIEILLDQGQEVVKNAVATGMLEAMLAESSAGRFDMSVLSAFLGQRTKAYCRSWDAFTGNETPGL